MTEFTTRPTPPDAHGWAALLLVESLIRTFVEQRVVTARQAVDVVEVARDAQQALVDDAMDPPAAMQQAANLLDALVASIEADIND